MEMTPWEKLLSYGATSKLWRFWLASSRRMLSASVCYNVAAGYMDPDMRADGT
jgi:hypothetical protein